MSQINLGALLRETGDYANNLAATHAHDMVIATENEVEDAKMLAGDDGDWRHMLVMMLSTDHRIPVTPYDPEQVDC